MSTMESTTLKHERMYFDSREAKAVERMMLGDRVGSSYAQYFIAIPVPWRQRLRVLTCPHMKGKSLPSPSDGFKATGENESHRTD